MKNLTKGFILNFLAGILSLVGIIVYSMVMYKLKIVYVFLAIAVVLTAVALTQNIKNKHNIITEAIGWLNSMLTAAALIGGVYLMVNQIGYVIAKLDTVNTILAFIIFEVIAFVAMLLNIISSFMAVQKN